MTVDIQIAALDILDDSPVSVLTTS